MSVKSSHYNLFYPQKDGVAVFNAATGTWAAFSRNQAEKLRRNRPDSLDTGSLAKATSIGAIVPADRDELKWFADTYRAIMSDRAGASYIWVLTYRCNLRCPYCFEGEEKRHNGDMSHEMATRLLHAVQERTEREGTRHVTFIMFGGEPLLRLDECIYVLSTMKEWCQDRKIGFRGFMVSNGVLLKPETVQRLSPYLDGVQFTLDGPRDVHDSVRIGADRRPTFDRILAAAKLAANHGLSVHMRVQAHQSNVTRLPGLLNELRSAGVLGQPRIQFSVGMLRAYSRCTSCDSFAGGFVQPGSKKERLAVELAEELVPPGRPAVQFVPCVMARNQIGIDPKGDLYRCLINIGQSQWRVGYLRPDDRFAFTRGMKNYEGRDPTKFPTCRTCAYLPLCGGGCPTRALHTHDSYDHPHCAESKVVLDARIKSLIQRERQATKHASVSL